MTSLLPIMPCAWTDALVYLLVAVILVSLDVHRHETCGAVEKVAQRPQGWCRGGPGVFVAVGLLDSLQFSPALADGRCAKASYAVEMLSLLRVAGAHLRTSRKELTPRRWRPLFAKERWNCGFRQRAFPG